MAVELDHPFTTASRSTRATRRSSTSSGSCPCVEGGSVHGGASSPEKVKAEILMRMGAMSMKLIGTVEVVEQDEAAHTARSCASSRASPAGPGTRTPTSTFALGDGGGTIHTHAQITGKAASMGEGVVVGVLDALIKDFTAKLGQI